MKKILVASTNPGKLKELREMLGDDIEWVGLSDFPGIGEIEEDGQTFAENARKKALGYAKATGLWTLADDSGLVVDALGGQPGVKSARFAGYSPRRYEVSDGISPLRDKDTKKTKSDVRRIIDQRNIEKLLTMLKNITKEKRQARFVCCLCLASPEKVLIETQGQVEGVIIDENKGDNGFGYDPVFFVPKLNKTVAQLDSASKNAISHRGNAIRKLKSLLLKLL